MAKVTTITGVDPGEVPEGTAADWIDLFHFTIIAPVWRTVFVHDAEGRIVPASPFIHTCCHFPGN